MPYYPPANGIVERRNAEVMKHLRALSLEERGQHMWSQFLPVVQLILNSSHDFSVGRSPCSLIFGDIFRSPLHGLFDLDMTVYDGGDFDGFLGSLVDKRNEFVEASREYLRDRDARLKKKDWIKQTDLTNRIKFEVGDYVFLIYNSRPPTKLSPLLRGPFRIVDIRRDDIVQVEDLISFSRFEVHISEEILAIRAMDNEEFLVESIVEHVGNDISTWLDYHSVKDLEALDLYEQEIGVTFDDKNGKGHKSGKK